MSVERAEQLPLEISDSKIIEFPSKTLSTKERLLQRSWSAHLRQSENVISLVESRPSNVIDLQDFKNKKDIVSQQDQDSDAANQQPDDHIDDDGDNPSDLPDEVQKAYEDMDQARQEYIKTKTVSRSFWKNLKGNLSVKFSQASQKFNSLFNRFKKNKESQPEVVRALTPDEKMAEARKNYEDKRNDYITMAVFHEYEDENDNQEEMRQELANLASVALITETLNFSAVELGINRAQKGYKPYTKFYKNPWLRAAAGIGINAGIGLSASVGLLPVTAGLIGVRWALGTVGNEGALHGAQDLYSSRFGARSLKVAQNLEEKIEPTDIPQVDILTNSLGSLDEDRIRKNQEFKEDSTEDILYGMYREVLQDSIAYGMSVNGAPTYAEKLRMALGASDNLNAQKDKAVIFERRAQATRWAAAGVISAAIAALTSVNRLTEAVVPRPNIPSVPLTPVPEVPSVPSEVAAATFSYSGSDLYYQALTGHDNMSSLSGTAHNMLAESWGIHLDAVDPINNTHELSHTEYWERFYANKEENEKLVKALTDYVRGKTLESVQDGSVYAYANNDDIVWHFTNGVEGRHGFGSLDQLIKYIGPRNITEFIESLKRGVNIFNPASVRSA